MAVPQSLVVQALKLSDEEREELLHALLDSFQTEPVADLSPDRLRELDESLAEADRGELISADELLVRMRAIP